MSDWRSARYYMHTGSLAIEQSALSRMTEAPDELADASVRARLASYRSTARAGAVPGVAVIPVHGFIAPRHSEALEAFGGTGLDRLLFEVRRAVADSAVRAIILNIDSSGGAFEMVPETAAGLRALRGRKPLIAVANTVACSGAYVLAAQADEIVVSPSGQVGSIGLVSVHEDHTRALAKAGMRITVIRSGRHKIDANPFEPLSTEARAHLQGQTDHWASLLVREIAKGRGVSEATVRNLYGQGRSLVASRAVVAGLADRVATLDDVIRHFK